METQENVCILENLSESLHNTNTEFDNTTTSLSDIFLNVSEFETAETQTQEGQALYEVTTVVIVVLSMFYGAICVTAILGNLLVLRLVLVSKKFAHDRTRQETKRRSGMLCFCEERKRLLRGFLQSFVCLFPLQTYNFLQVVFPSINSFEYINILWFCFHWLAMSNSCCNPFIYAVFNKKFQTKLIKSPVPQQIILLMYK